MINQTLREHFNAQLFGAPDDQAYVVIDGAAAPGLLPRLNVYEGQYSGLYRGELSAELTTTTPYLVKLKRYSQLSEWLLNAWGQHRGIYALLSASVDFDTVRKHFRRLHIVHSTDNKPLYFRYYDPRTLRRYLTGCTPGQARKIFGPVQFYLLENTQDNPVQRYWETDTGVDQAPLTCSEPESPPTGPFGAVFPDETPLSAEALDWRAQQAQVHRALAQRAREQHSSAGLLSIDIPQMQQQRLAEEADFVQWYTDDYLPTHLSSVHHTFDPKKLNVMVKNGRVHEMVKNGRHQALNHGFKDPVSQVHFVTLMWHIGPDFHHFPGFQAIAQATQQPGPERIDNFYRVSDTHWDNAVQNTDDRHWFSEGIQ